MKASLTFSLGLASALLVSASAYAGDYVITLKDHRFSPETLTIPADEKVKLTIKNLDNTPAEFESHDLGREKVVGAKSEISVFVGPLKPGSYGYVDDFHEDTTKGTILVK